MAGMVQYPNSVYGVVAFNHDAPLEEVARMVKSLHAVAVEYGAMPLSTLLVKPRKEDRQDFEHVAAVVHFMLKDGSSAEEFMLIFMEEARKLPGFSEAGLAPAEVTAIL